MKHRNIFRKHIFCLDKQLSPLFCEHLINKFEEDPRKTKGITGGGFVNTVKQSTDLVISHKPVRQDWEAEDEEVTLALTNMLEKHKTHIEKHLPGCEEKDSFFDVGHQMQRTTPGGFYDWHSDASDSRQYTYIFYLNDVKGGGGYTEFCDGTRIYPKAGRALIFPATHQYFHRGVAPKKDLKYIITGWLYTPLTGNRYVFDGSGLGHLNPPEDTPCGYDNEPKHKHHGDHMENLSTREID